MASLPAMNRIPAHRTMTAARQLTHCSSMREKVFEHALLAQLGFELMERGMEFEILHGEADRDGYDIVLESGRTIRHTQLKVMVAGGTRTSVTINQRLASKPSGCVVWLTFDPERREFTNIRWFGAPPGRPLPDLGTRIARHSRGNSLGIKNYRAEHRMVRASSFETLSGISHLVDKLFGSISEEPLALLRSHFRPDLELKPRWLEEVAAGDFAAIPHDLRWIDSAPLAHLIDGYKLLKLISEAEPPAFLDAQRAIRHATGTWPGDAATMWLTLFLEARADRHGAHDHHGVTPQLDQLCRQLRDALVALSDADA
jgi:hypothetical protein